jgi:hypothetical protein
MPEAVPRAPVAEGRAEPVAVAAAEEPTATEAEEEVPAEADLVGIASILGAQTLSYLVDNQLCIVQEIHGLDLGRGSTQHGDG